MVKKIFISLLILIFVLAGILVFLLKPYERLEEVRTSNQLNAINAVFVNFTGDASCAKLYRYKDGNISMISSPIFPALAGNMPPPDDGPTAYSDNIFKLTGYDYQFIKTNLLTHNKISQKSNRFDVVSWEIVPPYKVWTEKTDEDGVILVETKSDPIAQSLDIKTFEPGLFQKANYIDCNK